MKEELAEDIYWVLTSKHDFTLNHPEQHYDRLKRERVKISKRYNELKSIHCFADAERIATIEWLISAVKSWQVSSAS